ncbi:hypothetical protein GCM10028809_31710 [Spirosoma gilvum]
MIGQEIDYLIDSSRSLTIDDVLRKPFQKGKAEILNLGTIPDNVWIRFSVASKTEKELYLEIVAPLIDTLQLVEIQNGSPKVLFEGGMGKPFRERPIRSENWLFNLNLNDGAMHTYYLKVHSLFPFQMPIAVSAKNKYAEYNQGYHLFWGLYIGFILFAFIYNFFIYLVVRERRYLYYILYILFSLTFYLGLQGYDFQFLWPDYPYLNYLLPVAICINNVLVTLFTMDFLDITRNQKLEYYFSLALIASFSGVALINLAGGIAIAVGLGQLLSLVACLFYIVAAVHSYRRRVPGARYFLVAWTIFLVLVFIYILGLNNAVPVNFFTSHCIFFGHMTEVGLLSFALASRINWLKLENERKQKEIIYQLRLNEEIQLEANRVLEQKVIERTAELKASQALLIQKEKLASLGELTAGIAHEVQNPLNFVNNFSQVCVELVDEINGEIQEGRIDEVRLITGDLRQNLEKITHHGNRASNIVKGMLEHSRIGPGEIQPTNLNVLANEYLRIAYHGQQAKDKTFTVSLRTEFDAKLPILNLGPQEIGQVLLNLYNNAFYAVWQRSKSSQPGGTYEPTIWVSTHATPGMVHIQVRDNGPGIADSIKAKIFHPFFTTKPTGEGTGLGLSLSYDIVTKGYGGELWVVSSEGEGAEFNIKLPV